MKKIKGSELFVKALIKEKVDTIFGYPGGQALDLFDALYNQDQINVILPRHEQALVHAADGYARSTGKVGVCLVTSGPGATNIVTGVATANYDSVPLVCFTGQVSTELIGNDAFQEVDTVGIVRSVCKYAVTVKRREDLAMTIKKAFYIAKTGKPGVVVIDLPKDVQVALGSDEYPGEDVPIRGYKPKNNVHIGQMKKAIEVLNNSQKPIFLIGGGVNVSRANKEMTLLAESFGIPVVTTIMGKGAIPTNHYLYVGNIGTHGSFAANQAVSNCDVLFSIGTRFNDRITGKTSEFAKNATIIHIDIDPASISRNVTVDVPIVGDAKNAIKELQKHAKILKIEKWIELINSWKKEYPISMKELDDILTPEYIIKTINENFDDVIVVTDVGQNQMWTTQFLELDNNKRLLTSGGLGTMGYGLPASIGAKIGCPKKDVVAISGDGGFQMNLQELATAVIQELPITICIFNNGYLGNVRQWQEMFYNNHFSSTCLRYRKSCEKHCNYTGKNCPKYIPDFVSLAESYGAKGIRVTKKEEVKDALMHSRKEKNTPTVIEFIINSQLKVMPMVTPGSPLKKMVMD